MNQDTVPVSRIVDITQDTPPGGFGAPAEPPRPNNWTADKLDELAASVAQTATGVAACHGEIRLLRSEVTAKLSQRALLFAGIKYGGTVAATLAATYLPKWAPLLGKLIEAAVSAAGGAQ